MIPALVPSILSQVPHVAVGGAEPGTEKNSSRERPGISAWPEFSIINQWHRGQVHVGDPAVGFSTKVFLYNQPLEKLLLEPMILGGGAGLGWKFSEYRQQIYGTLDFRLLWNVTSFGPDAKAYQLPWLANVGWGWDLGIILGGGKHLLQEVFKLPNNLTVINEHTFDSFFLGLSASWFLNIGAHTHLFLGGEIVGEYLTSDQPYFPTKEVSSGWRFDPNFKFGIGVP